MDNTECQPLLKIAFGSCIMPTQSFLDPASNIIQLTCTVPSWSLTQSGDKTITLYVVVSDQPHNILDAWPVGYFTYQSRKRSSAEIPLNYAMMMKRTKPSTTSAPSSSTTTVDVTDPDTQVQQQQQAASSYMLSTQQPYDYNYYGLSQQYMQPSSSSHPTSTGRSRQYFDDSTTPSQIMFPYRTPTSTDTFSYGTTDPMGLSSMSTTNVLPQGLTDPSATYGTTSSPSLSHPPIPSTTTTTSSSSTTTGMAPHLQQQQQHPPSISSSGAGLEIAPAALQPPSTSPTLSRPGISPTTPNPFANLLSHADLIIEGDMDAMMKDWTDQERQDNRRLVRFWRRQQNHEIICNCQSIPPTNRINAAQEIIVSCIYWEEKQDYYITSVDIIYLLEALIGVRFTTEEKNRVRRNLEGFRPLTVSKLKPDSSDFFRLIMAFNHPKPRNIEKDLKVFAWSSLPTALKKIISKYSASYSSTASVNLDVFTQ
ncbi:uncharacterized protein BX664DRAFT_333643 [Halteromyces radiatus]|uniref:uncharacterized protein n=1 Tax=Halteromyces radiatus TaxID=101107 RepID=UPI00221FA3B2|nr:uncharacterized protein BX664DRAFT_333643 [Halteromyces radiatus]KAI8089685.1 hypothetical protein BX664DRAFT_333643 [Halteromyces radiatus]